MRRRGLWGEYGHKINNRGSVGKYFGIRKNIITGHKVETVTQGTQGNIGTWEIFWKYVTYSLFIYVTQYGDLWDRGINILTKETQ